MTCYSPIAGYRSRTAGKAGGFGITFNQSESNGQQIKMACGQCIGCKLDRSRDWAIRCIHESQMHDENSFITLTYNTENLPEDQSLKVSHFQNFMKRLRQQQTPKKIRFLHSGEYGNTCPTHDKEDCELCGPVQRPHYHALLFGHDFADKYPWKERNGYQTYRSQQLEKLWPLGNSEIGTLTFESAGYVARYATKKITGDKALAHYEKFNTETGEVITVRPEYITMSRGHLCQKCKKPTCKHSSAGLGYTWYQKYKNDLFPEDECVIAGRIMKPPRYYAKMYQQSEPKKYEQMMQNRKKFFNKHEKDNTWPRLQDREKVKHAQLNQLPRQLKENQ